MPSTPDTTRLTRTLAGVGVVGVSAAVFWRTAYPTITWWDSANYSLAAATLGVTSSPGSLLLTLLGWLVTRLPLGLTTARVLALFAGVLAAVTVGLVYVAALRLLRITSETTGEATSTAATIGAALGALTFAFSAALWEYATQFTPYVLSAVFTALILVTMLRWWESADDLDAWRWLALLAFLFGLDFSVHRTNALLLPSVFAWILIRRWRTLAQPVAWLAGAAGMIAGLAVQLVMMPISATTRSPLNMFEPSNWSRFWDYVSLSQFGGGFLIDVVSRKSPFWSVQFVDLLRATRDNFFHFTSPTWILGLVPALAGVIGLITMWRRNRRLGAAFTLVLLLHATVTVAYFNIPTNYFRSLHRHYLPVFVTMAVAIAYGMSVLGLASVRMISLRSGLAARRRVVAALGAAATLLAPIAQLARNWQANDASRRYFARDWAVNSLEQLPPKAIYFTVGDNDTFPVMYMQAVEGVRPDVRIVNLSLANAEWYMRQIADRDPSFPLRLPIVVRKDSTARDTIAIPIDVRPEQLGLSAEFAMPDTIRLVPKPLFGSRMLPADWVLVDIVRNNAWRDPLTVAITVGFNGLSWLEPYARLDGLYWRIVPMRSPRTDPRVLRANLLERAEYRGYADPSIRLEDVSRTLGLQYFPALKALLEAEVADGARDRCRDAVTQFFAKLPPERLGVPAHDRGEIEARCKT